MQRSSFLTPQKRHTILKRFWILYSLLTVVFSILVIVLLAWYGNQPGSGLDGFSYALSLPILSLASVVINGISFYFQNRYLRELLKRSEIEYKFQITDFGIRFYFYNLLVAIALSILLFFPLLILIFFYWIYPVALWLIPCHLVIGFILGWDIDKQLHSIVRSSNSR